MNQTIQIRSFDFGSDIVLKHIAEALRGQGLEVMQSFDLQLARLSQKNCACPYHGTEICNCQMAVLQIYGETQEHAVILIHGHDRETNITLFISARQDSSPNLENLILQCISDTQIPTN
ncbi:MAG: hypothetical protein MUO76_12715 [Anaerolineaceae bacterium]|nr:hypothetical protein [Anaerolineaceae bacterium]